MTADPTELLGQSVTVECRGQRHPATVDRTGPGWVHVLWADTGGGLLVVDLSRVRRAER